VVGYNISSRGGVQGERKPAIRDDDDDDDDADDSNNNNHLAH
jgi:hypothetical protein